MKHKPWEVLHSEAVYSHPPYLTIHLHKVGLPDGRVIKPYFRIEAAKRELLEERGFASEEWISLGRFVPNSNYRCGECHLFLAQGARKIAEPDDDLEESELLLIALPELFEELRNGNVISLSTAAAISLASAHVKSC